MITRCNRLIALQHHSLIWLKVMQSVNCIVFKINFEFNIENVSRRGLCGLELLNTLNNVNYREKTLQTNLIQTTHHLVDKWKVFLTGNVKNISVLT